MIKYKFSIGECSFCGQGVAEIVKDVSDNDLRVMCSECYTVWNSPQDFIENKPNPGYQFTAKFTDSTLEEIIAKGWEEFIDKT